MVLPVQFLLTLTSKAETELTAGNPGSVAETTDRCAWFLSRSCLCH